MIRKVREAVILAAGLSTRLRDYIKERSKVLHPILNKPLLAFPIEVLMSVGIRNFKIVANSFNYNNIRLIVRRFINAKFSVIINNFPELGNGYSAILGGRHVRSDIFVLSMADHIYAPSIIEKLLAKINEPFDILIGGDSSPRFIDVREATKILANKDKVVKIGKKIGKYTHIDIGVFVVRRKIIERFDQGQIMEKLTWSDVINTAVKEGYIVRVVDVKGDYWTEIDTPRDLNQVIWGRRRAVVRNVLKQLEARMTRLKVLEPYPYKQILVV